MTLYVRRIVAVCLAIVATTVAGVAQSAGSIEGVVSARREWSPRCQAGLSCEGREGFDPIANELHPGRGTVLYDGDRARFEYVVAVSLRLFES